MRSSRPQMRASDNGLTLIELLVAMVIFSMLLITGTTGWSSYRAAVEHRGSAQELVSALRNAQQSALAEAVTYCVAIDPDSRTYTLKKFTCAASGTQVRSHQTQSARVTIEDASFTQTDGTAAATVSFFPRGSATPGGVKVLRMGSDKTYIISVEGLTGRVSLAG